MPSHPSRPRLPGETLPTVPHPIPYQGSKRRVAAKILSYFPRRVERLLEPCAGSGAVTLAAAMGERAERFALGETLAPLGRLWQAILGRPQGLADQYARLWSEAATDPRGYYDAIRSEFNADGEPAKLLYLLARCVKNAVRFNALGEFNQSPDRRRLGMRPEKMRREIGHAHRLLVGRTTVSIGDYAELASLATPRDLVYFDPPYQGTSLGHDRRYAAPLDFGRLVGVLAALRAKRVRFMVSLDGRSGNRTYGRALPRELGLVHIELFAGRSAQATLHGRKVDTVESLYLSPELWRDRNR
jgi:DNA adenine methylase